MLYQSVINLPFSIWAIILWLKHSGDILPALLEVQATGDFNRAHGPPINYKCLKESIFWRILFYYIWRPWYSIYWDEKDTSGAIKERLSFMSTIVLRLFIEKYPDLYKNFIHNSKVLTTLFDVCATLRHIPLYLNHTSDTITGQSLFTKIYKRSPLSIKRSGSLFTKSQRPVCIVPHPYPKVTYSTTTHMN